MRARRKELPFSFDERFCVLWIDRGIGFAARQSLMHRGRPWHRAHVARRPVCGSWQDLSRPTLNSALSELIFRRHRRSGCVFGLASGRETFEPDRWQGDLRRRWCDNLLFALCACRRVCEIHGRRPIRAPNLRCLMAMCIMGLQALPRQSPRLGYL